MRRRDFITLLGGAAVVWPIAGRAQQSAGKAPREIGMLSPFSRSDSEAWRIAFRRGLRELGWVEGENIRIEYRYAEGKAERLPELVADLISQKVEVIVVAVNTDALVAAKATKTIPIVMASAGDPVAAGLINSLARPGGNITGLSQMATDLAAKRLEMLKEVAPNLSSVGVLWNPRDGTSSITWQDIQLPARRINIELYSLEVKTFDEIDAAFTKATNAKVGALYILPAPIFVENEKRIADFAAKMGIPSVFHLPEFVRLGGLMAYGPDRADLFRRAATYVDKILKGANPGDLPVEQPTKFELVINLKTAKAIGVTVPPALLTSADEVIE
jgi:putative tryptophan/tyrosine transport system substrate-binding protein